MKKVESSNIEAVGWHEGTLTVHFKNGSVYTYADVPKVEHDKLITARSVGGHFNAHIKGAYKHAKGENWR